MKFRLVFTLDKDLKYLHSTLNDFALHIEKEFKELSFGEDVQEIYVGIQCVSPKFQSFFKLRKPKYVHKKMSYEKEGVQFEFCKMFEYEIQADFNELLNTPEKKVIEKISRLILESSNIIKDEIKIKKFDFDLFQRKLLKALNAYNQEKND